MTSSRRVAITVLGVVVGTLLAMANLRCSASDEPDGSPTTPDSAAAEDGAPGSPDLYTAACEGHLSVGPTIDLPDELAEISGIAPSSERADVVWAVGDGGSAASVYAVDLSGNIVTAVDVVGVDNNDWEDLAAGPGLDGSGDTWLYVADIGDNTSERERIRIQAFPEPSLSATSASPRTVLARYAAGATDAEALAVTDDGVWIVGKAWSAGSAPLYHLGFDEIAAAGDELAVVEPAGSGVDVDGEAVTALDAAPDTGIAAVRTYAKVRLFDQVGPDLAEVLDSEACDGPPIVEGQGESVAITADGRSLVTASEAGAAGPAVLHVVTVD